LIKVEGRETSPLFLNAYNVNIQERKRRDTMIQGSTPLHIFRLPFSTDIIYALRISYEQNKKIVLSKELDNVSLEENAVKLRLSQEETLLFDAICPCRIQMHILTTGGDAVPSKIKTVPVHVLLDRRVIE
jgi:hypothetical protein